MNETEGKEGVGTASRVCPPGREIGMEPSRSFHLSPSRITRLCTLLKRAPFYSSSLTDVKWVSNAPNLMIIFEASGGGREGIQAVGL